MTDFISFFQSGKLCLNEVLKTHVLQLLMCCSFSWCYYVILGESEGTTSFLTQLATWDKEEMNEKLQQRVGFSKRAIGKLLQAFDGMLQRYETLTSLLHDSSVKDKDELSSDTGTIYSC